MGREPKQKVKIKGSQLLARGDIVRVMEEGSLVKCKVLSCVAAEGGGFHASLEIMEGDRSGERIAATLKPAEGPPAEESR
jgi:hypothetical protein